MSKFSRENIEQKLSELMKLNSLFLDEKQLQQLSKYVDLLLNFNQKMNLISRKDEDKILERHIIPCIIFSTLFKNFDQSLLDIGTGGGLPGIIFSIVNKNSRSVLIDSIRKKIGVLEQIVQIIGLDNVTTIWTRSNDKLFIKNYSKKFDLIISRATADLGTLIKHSTKLVKDPESKLAAMKGGDLIDEEISEAKKRFNYIAIQKIPLIYLPENPRNINKKFAIVVERINGRK